METNSMEPEEKLATALLPYLENPDEGTLASLTDRLGDLGIVVHTEAVVPGSSSGFSITFTKQGCPTTVDDNTSQLRPDQTWDLFCGLLDTAEASTFHVGDKTQTETETQTADFSLDLFGSAPLLHAPTTDLDFLGLEGVDISDTNNAYEKTIGAGDATQTIQGLYEDPLPAEELATNWTPAAAINTTDNTHGQNRDECDVEGSCLDALLGREREETVAGMFSSAPGEVSLNLDAGETTDGRESDVEDAGSEQQNQAKRRKISGCRRDGNFPNHEDTNDGNALAMVEAQFGIGTKYNLCRKTLVEILELAREVIRPDLIDFLEEALPRWQACGGLWRQEQLPEPLQQGQGTGHARLFTAYSCICKLEARMGDDQVRNRMAVVMLHSAYEQACKELRAVRAVRKRTPARTAKGRGDASAVIDDILARLHDDDWKLSERKSQLRNRFHDKKRYGKRWLILTQALGDSLLFACSPRIASVTHNTVFTVDMLHVLTYCVQNLNPGALRILEVLNRSASLILQLDQNDHDKLDPEAIVTELRTLLLLSAPEVGC